MIEMQRPGLVLACQEHLLRKAEKIGYDGMHKERVRIQTRVQKAEHVNVQDIKKREPAAVILSRFFCILCAYYEYGRLFFLLFSVRLIRMEAAF